ncbi:MAG: hypothetical protein HYY93_16500 [Planctomycetes bacterium]|nr:hypothetical protein [Planctomycetota bacterium]
MAAIGLSPDFSDESGTLTLRVDGSETLPEPADTWLEVEADGFANQVLQVEWAPCRGRSGLTLPVRMTRELSVDVQILPSPEIKSDRSSTMFFEIRPLRDRDEWTWEDIYHPDPESGGFEIKGLSPGVYTIEMFVGGVRQGEGGSFRVPRSAPLIVDPGNGVIR